MAARSSEGVQKGSRISGPINCRVGYVPVVGLALWVLAGLGLGHSVTSPFGTQVRNLVRLSVVHSLLQSGLELCMRFREQYYAMKRGAGRGHN